MKLAENTEKFLDRATEDFARIEAGYFHYEMTNNFIDMEIESPIEQIFWVAFHLICRAAGTDVDPEPYELKGKAVKGNGVFIYPQHKIGKYKVDFLIEANGLPVPPEFTTPIIIELDGHDFHDKDKRQRAYEKFRDRFLVKEGYRVFHFTGSEVVKDPYKIAYEAADIIGALVGSDIGMEYDPKDPLWLDKE